MMVRLDFTGRAKQAARALRVAARPAPGVAIAAEAGPHLPFKDGSVDELFLGRSIAWRTDIAETLDELWRVSKPGALIHVTLPHASSTIAATRDPRPRPLLSLNTFNYYDPRLKPADAPETAFVVERAMLRVVGQRGDDTGLALARGPFARFIEKLANGSRGSQYRFERWFGSFIGGFEEFDVVLAAVKHAEKSRPGHLARSMARPDAALPGEAAVADPTGLHVTSDVGHEAAVIDQDAAGLLPSADTTEAGPPGVDRRSERGQ